jgi:superfamily II DNA or RNA helicase
MSPSERLKAQIAFENKEVQVVCATNVLAQGVNFECENVIIERDPFETPEQQQQKLGRLGRPGTLSGKDKVYYTISNKLDKPEVPKVKTKIVKSDCNNEYIYDQLRNAIYKIKYGYKLTYNDIKYCIPQFRSYVNNYIPMMEEEYNISEKEVKEKFSDQIDAMDSTLEMISHEEEELTHIILNNMRKTPSLD